MLMSVFHWQFLCSPSTYATYATNTGTISQHFGGEYLPRKGHLNAPERKKAATNPLFVF